MPTATSPHVAAPFDSHPLAREAGIRFAELAAQQGFIELRTIRCQSCGVETALNTSERTAGCPHCGISNVNTAIRRLVRPVAQIPSRLSPSQVVERLRRWRRRHPLTLGPLLEIVTEADRLQLIHIPYWIFDCQTITRFKGERLVAESTTWTATQGIALRRFEDLLVPASTSLDSKSLCALTPLELRHLEEFGGEVRASLECYRMDWPEAFRQAAQRLEARIESDLAQEKHRLSSIETRYQGLKFKHLAYPVWSVVFRYKDKPYRLLVDAQTGEVVGDLPLSPLKVAGVLLAPLVLALFSWLLMT